MGDSWVKHESSRPTRRQLFNYNHTYITLTQTQCTHYSHLGSLIQNTGQSNELWLFQNQLHLLAKLWCPSRYWTTSFHKLHTDGSTNRALKNSPMLDLHRAARNAYTHVYRKKGEPIIRIAYLEHLRMVSLVTVMSQATYTLNETQYTSVPFWKKKKTEMATKTILF